MRTNKVQIIRNRDGEVIIFIRQRAKSHNYHRREPSRLQSNITIEQYLEKKYTVTNPTKYKP